MIHPLISFYLTAIVLVTSFWLLSVFYTDREYDFGVIIIIKICLVACLIVMTYFCVIDKYIDKIIECIFLCIIFLDTVLGPKNRKKKRANLKKRKEIRFTKDEEYVRGYEEAMNIK